MTTPDQNSSNVVQFKAPLKKASANTAGRISARAQANNASTQAGSAVEQVTALTKDFQILYEGAKAGFEQLDERVLRLGTILGAMLEVHGADFEAAVKAKIEENRAAEMARLAEDAKKALQTLVDEKIAIPATVVEPGSIIVAHETDETGQIIPPGRIQLEVSEKMRVEFREQLLGRSIGDSIAVGVKKLHVTEIYNIDRERAVEFEAAQNQKAPQAAEGTPQ